MKWRRHAHTFTWLHRGKEWVNKQRTKIWCVGVSIPLCWLPHKLFTLHSGTLKPTFRLVHAIRFTMTESRLIIVIDGVLVLFSYFSKSSLKQKESNNNKGKKSLVVIFPFVHPLVRLFSIRARFHSFIFLLPVEYIFQRSITAPNG